MFLLYGKSDRFLADWKERQNDKEPVMKEDLLAGLVRLTVGFSPGS
jgi:hypothetical protein